MADCRTAIRDNYNNLVTQLSNGDCEGVLDLLYEQYIVTDDDHKNLRSSSSDTPRQIQDKIRRFLDHLKTNLTENGLRIFCKTLEYKELNEIAKLLEQHIPQPAVCHVNSLRP